MLLYLLGDQMSAIYEYGELKKQDGLEIGKKEGKKEGKIEGKIEGMIEGKKEIIKNLYESGMSIKEIAIKTKMDINQVEKILN